MHEPGVDMLSRRGRWFVVLWSAGILLLYVFAGYVGVRQLRFYKSETEKIRWAAIGAALGPAAQSVKPVPGIKPVDVATGIYINRIEEFSMSRWAADFDIWFRWSGGDIDPGEGFQIINGEVESQKKIAVYSRAGERYERYRVKAHLTKLFDPSRFPFSEEELTVQVEDAAHGPETIRYVADVRDSGVNPAGVPRSLRVGKSTIGSGINDYGSRMGATGLSAAGAGGRSRLVFAVFAGLPGMAVYMRMSQALFVSVAIAFIVFFIRPTFVDPRFGLGIGAVFAAVANNIYVQSMLPPSAQVTLAQMVYVASLATILLILVQSAVSLYILDTLGGVRLSRFFDKASFAVFLTGYTAVNLALPLAAGA